MLVSLTGKNALVTGGTRGIGSGITLALAEAGANVVTCNRSGEADDLVRRLKETGGEHALVAADVGDPAAVDALLTECRSRLGSLDILVNNAGAISHVPFEQLPLAEWQRILDVNLTGAFLVTQKALSLMSAGGSIVNVGSRSAQAGIPLRSHYTAAKAALVGLTRSLARELGPRGIRVNVLAPGVVDTDTERKLPPEMRAEMAKRYGAMTALGRVGEIDEVAGAALFLASDLSRYVTGETLNVDGGI